MVPEGPSYVSLGRFNFDIISSKKIIDNQAAMTAMLWQLDVCGFTALSRTLPPMAIAKLIHALFSAFDRTVRVRARQIKDISDMDLIPFNSQFLMGSSTDLFFPHGI